MYRTHNYDSWELSPPIRCHLRSCSSNTGKLYAPCDLEPHYVSRDSRTAKRGEALSIVVAQTACDEVRQIGSTPCEWAQPVEERFGSVESIF